MKLLVNYPMIEAAEKRFENAAEGVLQSIRQMSGHLNELVTRAWRGRGSEGAVEVDAMLNDMTVELTDRYYTITATMRQARMTYQQTEAENYTAMAKIIEH